MADTKSSRSQRPTLIHSSLSGGSFLKDHQQYKESSSPSAATFSPGVRDLPVRVGSPLTLAAKEPGDQTQAQNGQRRGSARGRIANATVTDSGIVHSIFNDSLSSLSPDTPKIVATLLYTPPTDGQAAEQETADTLYGKHVSQLCVASFLQIMESLSKPYQRLNTSHRCLDKEDEPQVVEVTISPPPTNLELSFEDLRKHEDIHLFERTWNVEVLFQRESVFRRYKRLAVFDMDSTLIQQEVIDEIADFIGVKEQVADITSRAMRGDLDFSSSLRERVSLLKGVPSDVFEQLKPRITITPGARELCRALKTLGFKLAVLSGGFQPLADWIAETLGLDYAFANHLATDPETNTLSGTLEPGYEIVNAEWKLHLLRSLAADNHIPLSQTLAVGDGANDLLMLYAAGLGVAWRAKERVQFEAPTRLNGESLVDILYLLGLTNVEIGEIMQDSE